MFLCYDLCRLIFNVRVQHSSTVNISIVHDIHCKSYNPSQREFGSEKSCNSRILNVSTGELKLANKCAFVAFISGFALLCFYKSKYLSIKKKSVISVMSPRPMEGLPLGVFSLYLSPFDSKSMTAHLFDLKSNVSSAPKGWRDRGQKKRLLKNGEDKRSMKGSQW